MSDIIKATNALNGETIELDITGWTLGEFEKLSNGSLQRMITDTEGNTYTHAIINGEHKIARHSDYIGTDGQQTRRVREAIESLLLAKMYREARDVIVKHVLEREHIYTERQDDNPPMFIYHEGIYVTEARTYIRTVCELLCGKGYTRNISNEVIARIEAQTYINGEELYAVKHPYIIPVKNGLLNLLTGDLGRFDPKKIFFTKIPVTYNPSADCPRIKKFISEVVSASDVQIIQEQFGYTLVKAYPIPKCFLYTGMGRNGKSTVIQLQKEFLGADNVTSVPLQDLEDDQYAASELFSKLACIGGDLSSSGLKNTGKFKQLTGGDMISANRKFMNRLNFRNYAKLIFSANQIPYSTDNSDGFFSRWIIIDFPNKFYTEEEIACMSEEQRANVRKADRHIIDKLCTPEELSGLLNWALQGLQTILRKGNFSTSATTESIKEMYLRKSNSLNSFVADCCSFEDANAITPKEDFRKAYMDYCAAYNLPVKTEKQIARFMKENEVWTSKSNATRMWQGIQIVKFGQLGQLGHDILPLRQLSSNIESENTCPSCPPCPSLLEQVLTLIKEKDKGYGVAPEYIEKKVPGATIEVLKEWEFKGELLFTADGWVRSL